MYRYNNDHRIYNILIIKHELSLERPGKYVAEKSP